ncbi:MAG: choice-of-anchor V domain-containing protein [Terriglobia bacterium]
MIIKRKFSFGRIALVLTLAPLTLHGYEFGPDAGFTNAPGDNKTSCIASNCHIGTVNSGPGGVKILLPSGNSGTYTPGQSMQLLVQITDSTKSAYGFEMTARLGAGNTAQAGDFSTPDNLTQVLCANGDSKANGKTCAAPFDVQYIEHTITGFTASLKTTPTFTYTVNWTPPATSSGPVTFYAAANAGPGFPAVPTPTNVYTTSLVLTPAAASTGPPTIKSGGIVPIYSTRNTIQPNSWISIYGANLANATAVWNGVFPIPSSLGGTTVSINNKPALLWVVVHDAVNGDQINLQAPDDSATGSVPVTVTTANGSVTTSVTLGNFSPSFSLLDVKYPAAIVITPGTAGNTGSGYDIIGPVGRFPYATRPAKKGDTLVLFGVGFGPTNPPVPAGTSPPATGATALTTPTVTIGGVDAPVVAATLPLTGLFQIIVTVPANIGTGDQPLVATSGGLQTLANVFVAIQ